LIHSFLHFLPQGGIAICIPSPSADGSGTNREQLAIKSFCMMLIITRTYKEREKILPLGSINKGITRNSKLASNSKFPLYHLQAASMLLKNGMLNAVKLIMYIGELLVHIGAELRNLPAHTIKPRTDGLVYISEGTQNIIIIVLGHILIVV